MTWTSESFEDPYGYDDGYASEYDDVGPDHGEGCCCCAPAVGYEPEVTYEPEATYVEPPAETWEAGPEDWGPHTETGEQGWAGDLVGPYEPVAYEQPAPPVELPMETAIGAASGPGEDTWVPPEALTDVPPATVELPMDTAVSAASGPAADVGAAPQVPVDVSPATGGMVLGGDSDPGWSIDDPNFASPSTATLGGTSDPGWSIGPNFQVPSTGTVGGAADYSRGTLGFMTLADNLQQRQAARGSASAVNLWPGASEFANIIRTSEESVGRAAGLNMTEEDWQRHYANGGKWKDYGYRDG